MFPFLCFYNNDQDPSPDNIVDQNSSINSNPIIQDLFTDTNGTAISAHTPNFRPNGNAWSQTAGTSFFIQSNSLQPNRQIDGDIAIIDSGVSDLSISCDVTPFSIPNNRAYAGIVFRYSDANNFWYIFPDSDNQWVQLYQVQGGVSTERLHNIITLVSGNTYNIRVDCKGNNITFYFNGTEIVTYVSSFNNNATKVGVRYGKSGSPAGVCSWDNFKVLPFSGINFNWPLFSEFVSNPILSLGAGGSWESSDINDPNVVFDSVNNRWVLLYSGYDGSVGNNQQLGLGYSTGTTILGSWSKEAGNPVFSGGGTNGQNGGIVKLGSTYYYYYGTNSASKISCATSTDLITWTGHGVVINVGAGGQWDAGGVFDAFARLRQDGVTIEVWYAAKDGSNNRAMGYATSTDGLTFTKSSGNPLISSTLANQPWAGSTSTFGEPSVYVPPGREGQQYLVSFDSAQFATPGNRFISQAISLDGGSTWHYRKGGLQASGVGWESAQVFDSFVMVDSNIMYLFHGGADTAGASLGLNIEIGVASVSYSFSSLFS